MAEMKTDFRGSEAIEAMFIDTLGFFALFICSDAQRR